MWGQEVGEAVGGTGLLGGWWGDHGAHHGILGEVVVGAPSDRVQLHEVLKVGDLPQDPFLSERSGAEMGWGEAGNGTDPPTPWLCSAHGHPWSPVVPGPTLIPGPTAIPGLLVISIP